MDMAIPEGQDMEASEEEFIFNYLPSNFPEEFKELCLIPPLRGNDDLIERVQSELGEIVSRHHLRFSQEKDYFIRVEQCIRSVESAAQVLDELFKLFMKYGSVP
jgi:hypothetical protein